MKLTIDGMTSEQFNNMFCIENDIDMANFVMMLVRQNDNGTRLVSTVI